MDKKFYNMKELADIMPLGTSRLYSLVHSKDFPAITVNRKILIPVDEFDQWIKSSTGKKIIL